MIIKLNYWSKRTITRSQLNFGRREVFQSAHKWQFEMLCVYCHQYYHYFQWFAPIEWSMHKMYWSLSEWKKWTGCSWFCRQFQKIISWMYVGNKICPAWLYIKRFSVHCCNCYELKFHSHIFNKNMLTKELF